MIHSRLPRLAGRNTTTAITVSPDAADRNRRLESRHRAMRRIARANLESGLLPWGAPRSIIKQRDVDQIDIVARELGVAQVRVIPSVPEGCDCLTVRRAGIVIERRVYQLNQIYTPRIA